MGFTVIESNNPNTPIGTKQSDILISKKLDIYMQWDYNRSNFYIMRHKHLSISILFIWATTFSIKSKGQCDDKLGYNTQGSLGSTKSLKGYLSQQDTAMKMFLSATIAKTEMTNGITLYGFFSKVGTIDYTTKVKITFKDSTYITLTDYLNSSSNRNSENKNNNIGFFTALITDKYNLLLLKTKPVMKIQITGAQLDATTYMVDGIVALDFLLGMDCLEQYL